jgi:hypothetical protein
MSESDGPKNHSQLVKTVDVLFRPSRLSFPIKNAQRLLILPLVAMAAVGIVLYLYSFIVPFLAIPLSMIEKNSATEVFFRPIVHWLQEGIRPMANMLLTIPLLSLPVVLPLLMITAWLQGIATHIRLGNSGFRFGGQLGGLLLSSPLIPWSALASTNAVQPVEAKDEVIELNILDEKLSWRTWLTLCLICPKAIKRFPATNILRLQIPLQSLPSELERERLVLALGAALPQADCVSGFTKRCPTYTELWLEGLSPETSSDVLTEGITISEGKYVIEEIIGTGNANA